MSETRAWLWRQWCTGAFLMWMMRQFGIQPWHVYYPYLSACMFECMYLCLYVCLYYVCMYGYVCMFVRIFVCLFVCMYVCMYVCVYVCTFVCFCVSMCEHKLWIKSKPTNSNVCVCACVRVGVFLKFSLFVFRTQPNWHVPWGVTNNEARQNLRTRLAPRPYTGNTFELVFSHIFRLRWRLAPSLLIQQCGMTHSCV